MSCLNLPADLPQDVMPATLGTVPNSSTTPAGIAPAEGSPMSTAIFGFDTVPPAGDAALTAGGGEGGNGILPPASVQLALPDPGEVAAVPRTISVATVNPLIASQAEIDRARVAATLSKDEGCKPVVLPPITPGFKSNALDLPVPPKVDNAFRLYCYVPYTSLTQQARLKALRGEEDFVVNAHGGLTAKGLDRLSEKSISLPDWLAAATVAEQKITEYHGLIRGQAFAAHHKIVEGLTRSHGLGIAFDYDIQQREAAANNVSHDLSGLDSTALTLIATRALISTSSTTPSASSSARRPPPIGGAVTSLPNKKPRTSEGVCF